jgi:hypothetical protein
VRADWLFLGGRHHGSECGRFALGTEGEPRTLLAATHGRLQAWRTTMSKTRTEVVSVKILPNQSSNPSGKLADAEVVFEADAGPLNGLN